MRGHNTGRYYPCFMYVRLYNFNALHKKPCRIGPGLCELPKTSLLRTRVDRGPESRRCGLQPDEIIRAGLQTPPPPGACSTRRGPPCPQAAPCSPPTTSSALRWQGGQSATRHPTSPCPPTAQRPAPTAVPLARCVPSPGHEDHPSSRKAVFRHRYDLQLRVPPVLSTRCARAQTLPGAQGLPRPTYRRSDLGARALLPNLPKGLLDGAS